LAAGGDHIAGLFESLRAVVCLIERFIPEGHAMKIRGRSSGVIKFKVEGPLVMGAAPSLHALVAEVAMNRPVVVLVCMAGVTDMDAHGIGELVAILTMLERSGGRMALIAPSAHVRLLLSITHLDSVFTIYNSALEALVRLARVTVTAALLRKTYDHQLRLQPCA
jgi:anti-sigma B factor antagonist